MLTTFKATAKKLPAGLQVETESRGFKLEFPQIYPQVIIFKVPSSTNFKK